MFLLPPGRIDLVLAEESSSAILDLTSLLIVPLSSVVSIDRSCATSFRSPFISCRHENFGALRSSGIFVVSIERWRTGALRLIIIGEREEDWTSPSLGVGLAAMQITGGGVDWTILSRACRLLGLAGYGGSVSSEQVPLKSSSFFLVFVR